MTLLETFRETFAKAMSLILGAATLVAGALGVFYWLFFIPIDFVQYIGFDLYTTLPGRILWALLWTVSLVALFKYAQGKGSLVAKEIEDLTFQEALVRFCPGCGCVGDVDGFYKNCCPDGYKARMIPQSMAGECHELFQLAVGQLQSTKQEYSHG